MSNNIPADDGSTDIIPFDMVITPEDAAEDLFLPEVDNPSAAAPADIVRANNGLLRDWLPVWLSNMGRCLSLYYNDTAAYKAYARFARPDGPPPKDLTSAVVCGSGPSLEDAIPYLQKYDGTIICGPTNIAYLWKNNIRPHFMLLVDVGPFTTPHLLKNTLTDADYRRLHLFRPACVVPTTCSPDAAAAVHGKRFWFKHAIQGANGLRHPYNVLTGMLVPDLGDMMLQAGCVANSAICLPQLLALDPDSPYNSIQNVFLVGVDYAFQPGRGRIPDVRFEDGRFEEEPRKSAQFNSASPHVLSARGIPTDLAMLAYKRSLITLWEILFPKPGSPAGSVRLWTTTPADKTIIDEIPYAPISVALTEKRFKLRPYTYEELMAQYKRYFTETAPLEGQAMQTKEQAEQTGGPRLLPPIMFSNVRRNFEEAIVLLKTKYNTDTEENAKILDEFFKNVDIAMKALPENTAKNGG